MALLNDEDAWRGDIDVAIAMSIRDAGMPLVNLTHHDEVGPSRAVKDESADKPVDMPDERGKKDAVDNNMYNLDYDPSGRR
jgi:hypothetical protein